MLSNEEWLEQLCRETGQPPFLPIKEVQVTTTGRNGRPIMADALAFYEFIKTLMATYAKPLSRGSHIVDFGCGWGRILRAFLRDVDTENLIGLDAQQWLIDIARETTGVDLYRKVDQLPPAKLPTGSIDMIYAYSVFSHLSEATAAAWIDEFERLLAPNGLIVVTTRPRAHINVWAEGAKTAHSDGYASLFDVNADLDRYDRGEYVFHSAPSHDLTAEHYGEAVISLEYAQQNWTHKLSYIGYFDRYSSTYMQPAIVLQKNKN